MWRRLPLPVRAILTGIIVAGVPTMLWSALAGTNLRLDPAVPWSAPVMAGVLWLYWRYVRGDGPPRRLAGSRRDFLRAVAVGPQTWGLSLVAGGTAIAAVWAAFAALRGVMHIAAPSDELTRLPIVTVIASLLMAAAVAGITEEAGFRGYMQVPLERAYGPAAAIATTSVVFTAIHLTHGARILPFLPFFLVVAVVYGLVAFLTGSILPSITLHFIGDVFMFAFQFIGARHGTLGSDGSGTISLAAVIVFAALAAMSLAAFRLLAREARVTAPDASMPAMG
jgi:membrane protease YdiL (CAAX protease family)